MKLLINGQTVIGHPGEIAELLKRMSSEVQPRSYAKPKWPPRKPDSAKLSDLENEVLRSRELREQLDQDPHYNPYPGVLTPNSQEAQSLVPGQQRLYGADRDTGVQYQE